MPPNGVILIGLRTPVQSQPRMAPVQNDAQIRGGSSQRLFLCPRFGFKAKGSPGL